MNLLRRRYLIRWARLHKGHRLHSTWEKISQLAIRCSPLTTWRVFYQDRRFGQVSKKRQSRVSSPAAAIASFQDIIRTCCPPSMTPLKNKRICFPNETIALCKLKMKWLRENWEVSSRRAPGLPHMVESCTLVLRQLRCQTQRIKARGSMQERSQLWIRLLEAQHRWRLILINKRVRWALCWLEISLGARVRMLKSNRLSILRRASQAIELDFKRSLA